MAYNNTSNKVTYLKFTGTEVINNNYVVIYDSLINPDDILSSSIGDQDEIVVVRKFDSGTITDSDYTHGSAPVTSAEAWSCWTLPNTNSSGSSMYTMDTANKTITFNTTTDSGEWDWLPAQSGRTETISLPSITASDSIYVLRKTYSLTKLVEFTSGSRINSDNLNYIIDQLIFMAQESSSMLYNIAEWCPAAGQPNGLAILDSLGKIDTTLVQMSTSSGIQGIGTPTDTVRLNLADDSLVVASEQVKVGTVDNLSTTSATKPLSANQGYLLNQLIDSMSSGTNYKGTLDVDSMPSEPSAVAGDTYDIIESVGSGTTVDLDSSGGIGWNAGSAGPVISAGNIIRYDGTNWVKLSTGAYVTVDGTTELTADWDAGSTHYIEAETVAATDTSRKLATTAHVKSIDIADLNDVTDYGSGTNGHLLKRVSGAWVSVDPDDGTNGISVHNLKDVQDAAATDGHFLKWEASSSSWVGAATGSSTKIAEPLSAGNADGTTDDQSDVSTALNAVGIAGGSVSSTSVYGSADLLGRHFAVNSTITAFAKSDVQWRHGKLNWIDADSAGGTMIKCGTETNSTVTYINSAAAAGDMSIVVASGSNLAADDLIQIYSTDTSSSNIDVGRRSGGDVLAFELHYIDRVDGTTMHLKEPLLHNWDTAAANSRVIKKGVDTNAQQQPHDILIEDMVFDDTLHQVLNLANSAVTLDYDDFGSTDLGVALSAHGLGNGAKGTLDMAIFDVDSTWSGAAGNQKWAWLNGRTFAVANTATNSFELTFTGHADTPSVSSSQTSPIATTGDQLMAMLGGSIGIHIENGYRIHFRNCRFKGFALGQVKLTGCRDVSFEDCEFEGLKWTGTEGNAVVLKQCRDISFRRCTFRNVSHGIAYDGTGAYTAVMGLTVEDCKFVAVTSGIRDINTGVVYDVKIKNTSVECVSFNPARNYPIADEDVVYPVTGMKLVGLKIEVDQFTCNALSKWDAVSPSETSASVAITDYYNTGKGWATRWTSNSHSDHAETPVSMIGTLQPITAYGLKIVTFGTFDLMTRAGSGDYSSFITEPKSNTCSALKITNCDINAWLCGIHVSAELGTSSNAYITKGITINENNVESLCNGITIYTGQENSNGIHDFNFRSNTINIGRSGSIMRFVGVRKLQGLTGNSRSGAVVNCTAASEYVEGPALPQYQHAFRWWCDTKGTYLQPTESEARKLSNENINVIDNSFVHHGPGNNRYRDLDSTLWWIGNGSTAGTAQILWTDTTNLETNRELINNNLGTFIIWGRHVGGEIWNQGVAEGENPGSATHAMRISNTNNLTIQGNRFSTTKYGNALTAAGFFCQFSPYVKGAVWTHEAFAGNSYQKENAGMFGSSITHSIITENTVSNRYVDMKEGWADSSSPSSVDHYPSDEPILGTGEGLTAMRGSQYQGDPSGAHGPWFYQRMGWCLHYTIDAAYCMARRNEFTANWCGNNNMLGTSFINSYHHSNHRYASGITAHENIPIT